MIPSAYIHVPFCSSICSYCAFSKTARLSLIDAWLDALETEVKHILDPVKETEPGFCFETLYIGGGTPSVLNHNQTKRLMDLLSPYAGDRTEWTIEANPESIDEEKIRLWKDAGVNRVSIGIESFDDHRLRMLGRRHRAKEAREAIALLKKAGIERICADLMYGFPDESLQDLEVDLKAFLELEIPHLSIYSLILEEGTRLGRLIDPNDLDEELNAQMYETIVQTLAKAGYEHYEISSFARNQDYGRHNVLIWKDGAYYGFGYGACGRDEHGLYEHGSRLDDYLNRPLEKLYVEDLNPEFDALMTGLRTMWGVDLDAWQKRYGIDFFSRYGHVLEKWNNVFELQDDHLALNEAGMEVLDSVLVDFLCEEE